ncbi:hypothetical protein J9317_16685 [Metabacillus sp. KIGAM252]|uniref:Uncharacterized protein n=1 Tax=Metabacillus flavus TaxID=2823519 RepID=A0ABS5LI01_9BACI|nr:hypothetical protein [Metabacillus flavus]MBS2970385.1 hypothetical protein [Metabacillus flavus]
MSKAERQFIKEALNACLKNDTRYMHMLVDVSGETRYMKISSKDFNRREEQQGEGRVVKPICIFSNQLINDFHERSKQDSKRSVWIREGVHYVLSKAKKDFYT